jgi:prepilin-type N-terminal cleavage/methylation domain-containing protein
MVRVGNGSHIGMNRRSFDSGRRGFSMLEAIVVFALIAVLAGVAYATIGNQNSPSGDMAARASLVHAQSLQSARPDAPVSDPAVLAELDPTRTWTTAASSASDVVSVRPGLSDPAVVAFAASNGTTCWLLRLDYAAAGRAGATIWALADSGECNAIRALELTPDPTGERGESADRPLIL